MSDRPIDPNQPAPVRLTYGQWNVVLMLLRTGAGVHFTWDVTNPLIAAVGQQLHPQLYPQQPQQGVRGNGEDLQPAAAGAAAQGFRPPG